MYALVLTWTLHNPFHCPNLPPVCFKVRALPVGDQCASQKSEYFLVYPNTTLVLVGCLQEGWTINKISQIRQCVQVARINLSVNLEKKT